MPRVTKTVSASKAKTTLKAADSWLAGAKAVKVKATPAKKVAAKKASPGAVKARALLARMDKAKALKATGKTVRKPAAKKVVARKTKTPRQPKAAIAVKAIKTKLSRVELLDHLMAESGQEKTAVKAVLEALKTTMQGSLAPRGAGEFVLPGLFKIVTKKVPARTVKAIKAGTEVRNPRTGDVYAHEGRKAYTKPATVKVRLRAMAGLKNAAL